MGLCLVPGFDSRGRCPACDTSAKTATRSRTSSAVTMGCLKACEIPQKHSKTFLAGCGTLQCMIGFVLSLVCCVLVYFLNQVTVTVYEGHWIVALSIWLVIFGMLYFIWAMMGCLTCSGSGNCCMFTKANVPADRACTRMGVIVGGMISISMLVMAIIVSAEACITVEMLMNGGEGDCGEGTWRAEHCEKEICADERKNPIVWAFILPFISVLFVVLPISIINLCCLRSAVRPPAIKYGEQLPVGAHF